MSSTVSAGSTDIVERIRNRGPDDDHFSMLDAAADEIVRLKAFQDETAKAWTRLTESQEQEIDALHDEIAQMQELLRRW